MEDVDVAAVAVATVFIIFLLCLDLPDLFFLLGNELDFGMNTPVPLQLWLGLYAVAIVS